MIRERVDKRTGDLLSKEKMMPNHAKVLYDWAALKVDTLRKSFI